MRYVSGDEEVEEAPFVPFGGRTGAAMRAIWCLYCRFGSGCRIISKNICLLYQFSQGKNFEVGDGNEWVSLSVKHEILVADQFIKHLHSISALIGGHTSL